MTVPVSPCTTSGHSSTGHCEKRLAAIGQKFSFAVLATVPDFDNFWSMPDDNESLNFKHRLDGVEQAVNDNAKEIKQLKREIAGLRENLKDVLRILGVVYGTPYVQPKMTM